MFLSSSSLTNKPIVSKINDGRNENEKENLLLSVCYQSFRCIIHSIGMSGIFLKGHFKVGNRFFIASLVCIAREKIRNSVKTSWASEIQKVYDN